MLMGVVVALGCSRLDVIEHIGRSLGLDGAVDDLASADGVTISQGLVAIEAVDAPVATEPGLVEQAGRAAAELVAGDDLEEVGRLAIVAELPDVLEQAVHRALRAEPPRVPASVLRTWRDSEVLDADDPHLAWLDAACAAAAGAPIPEVLEQYEAVRARFQASGDVEAEIAVGMGAAVLARRTDDFGTLIRLVARAQEMVRAGSDAAIPPVVLGDALTHQLSGDPEGALDALDRFPSDWLEGDWAAQVLMMQGTNLLLIDRTDDALDAFEAATGHGSTWTYAVALELLGTARWNAGDRVGAIADLRRSEQLARAIGAVSTAALATAHLAVLEAADGRPEAPATARRAASQSAELGDEPRRLLAAAGVLRLAGAGDAAGAAREAEALELPTRAVRSAHWTVALLGAREPVAALGEAHRSLRHAIAAGRSGHQHLATGTPAPAADRRLLPGSWCEPEPPTVELRLLGTPTVLHDGRDIGHPDWERARVRELCLHLALVTTSARDQIASRLWPDLTREAASRNLRVTLSYLLNVLDPGRAKGVASTLVDDTAGTLSLASSPRLRIDVRDTARLADQILTGAAAGDEPAVVRAARRLVRLPDGDLLGGVASGEWIEQADRARGEQVIRASLAGGPALLRAGHAELAEAIVQRGLVQDPWAERLHQVVIRARLAVDDLDGARRALRRTQRALDELGVRPEPATVELARLVGVDLGSR